jgi:hypothetical protein
MKMKTISDLGAEVMSDENEDNLRTWRRIDENEDTLRLSEPGAEVMKNTLREKLLKYVSSRISEKLNVDRSSESCCVQCTKE